MGTHTADGPGTTVVEIGGNTADRLAAYLLSLGTPLTVLSPDEVREALVHRSQALLEANR
jgi:predicted DNA-binding transcriptional regulator YafY